MSRKNSFIVARKLSKQFSAQSLTSLTSASSLFSNSNSSLGNYTASDERIVQITEYVEEFVQSNGNEDYNIKDIEMVLLRPRMLEDDGTMKMCMLMLTQLDKMIKQAGVDCFEWIEFTASSQNQMKCCLTSSQFKAAMTRLCTDLRQPCYEDRDLLRLFRFIAGERDDAIVDHCNLDIALRTSRKNSAKLHKFKTFFTLVRDIGAFMKRSKYHLGEKSSIVDQYIPMVEIERLVKKLLSKYDAYVAKNGAIEWSADDEVNSDKKTAPPAPQEKKTGFIQAVAVSAKVAGMINRLTNSARQKREALEAKKVMPLESIMSRSRDRYEDDSDNDEGQQIVPEHLVRQKEEKKVDYDFDFVNNMEVEEKEALAKLLRSMREGDKELFASKFAKIDSLYSLTQRLMGWNLFSNKPGAKINPMENKSSLRQSLATTSMDEESDVDDIEHSKGQVTVSKASVKRKKVTFSESIYAKLKDKANQARNTLANNRD